MEILSDGDLLATLECITQTLPCVSAIDSNFVDLRGIISKIFHVPENMTSSVLADKVA